MGRTPNKPCIICGTLVYRRPTVKRVFCSMKCYGFSCRKPVKCPRCDEYFLTSKNSKFCSRTCSNAARAGIKYGLGQPKSNALRNSTSYKMLIERDGEQCKICGLGPIWNNKCLKLQIDHIDGNRYNNEDLNKRLLCPNCHSQTDTFGAKNIKRMEV